MTPGPEKVKVLLEAPVAVPEPLMPENEPAAPANIPVPPVIVAVPVADVVPPINGTRIPDGSINVPTNTSPPEKTMVKVPGIGPETWPERMFGSIVPAAESTADPKPVIEPVPFTANAFPPVITAFPDAVNVADVP